MELIPLLKALSEASGVSGYEEPVRDIIYDAFSPLCDDIQTDRMGNLIALKKGTAPAGSPRKRIMLAGHMDEIGLMVTHIDQGFIRFTQVGGYDVRILPAQLVNVWGRKKFPGIIGTSPPHVKGGSKGVTQINDLYIDIGLPPDDVEKQVRPGDIITLDKQCIELNGGLLCGKAFDDRASVAAIAVCLDQLSKTTHEWDVLAVATVQEEINFLGSLTSTFGLEPDVGIAIDVGFAKQPGVSEKDRIEMGKGPAIAIGPNLHPALVEALKQAADRIELAYQLEVAPRGTGTDANAIQLTRTGVPTGLLSIPERNMHTPVETINTKDVTRTGRLLAELISGMDGDFMDTLTWPSSKKGGAK